MVFLCLLTLIHCISVASAGHNYLWKHKSKSQDFLYYFELEWLQNTKKFNQERSKDNKLLDTQTYFCVSISHVEISCTQEGYIEELSTRFYLDTALLKSSERLLSET